MKNLPLIAKSSLMMVLISLASACVVAEPRNGYYDRDHHRYYHERSWHDCREHDEHCR
jgi:hypothetical protein